jgi:hypothetical protein
MRHRHHALRRRYGHAEAADWKAFDAMSPVQYHGALLAALQAAVGDRQPHVRLERSWGPGKEHQLYINYFNLPAGVGGAGGGAEGENNRASFWIRGFGAGDEPATKLRVEMHNSSLYMGAGAPSRETRYPNLRSKTAAPGVIAKYLVDYLAKVAREVPPRFTHTGAELHERALGRKP